MKIGLVLDPVEKINPKKDSSIALASSAMEYGWQCDFLAFSSLKVELRKNKTTCKAEAARFKKIHLAGESTYFELRNFASTNLSQYDAIVMRKDPPFNEAYLYATYVLSLTEKINGTLIVNNATMLRDFNEKFLVTHYPNFAPASLITQSENEIKKFVSEHQKAVIKPLDAMGGESIFILEKSDLNLMSILETMLQKYSWVMVQEFLPEIKNGDIRVLSVNGKVYESAIARMPHQSDFRGNLARGACSKLHQLTTEQKQRCSVVATELKEKGVLLIGFDLIGEKLSEINITSPTCFREYQEFFNINVGLDLVQAIAEKIKPQ